MNNLIKIFFLFFFLLNYNSLNSQPSITWEKLYGYPNSDEGAYDICESSDGNFFVVGNSGNSFINGRIYVLKINQYGDTLWTKKYNTGHYAYAVAPTSDCGCVITGYGLDSLYTLRLNCNGDIVWQKFYSSGAICYDIQKVSDGGYIACGNDGFNGYLQKIDSAGNFEWDTLIKAEINMYLYSICEGVNPQKNIVCAGTVREMGRVKAIILNVELSGKINWDKRINIKDRATTAKAIQKLDDYYIFSGSIPDLKGSYQTYFSKLDTSGNVLKTETFESQSIENNQSFKIIDKNNFVFVSDSYSDFKEDSLRSIIRKCDSKGNIEYIKKFYSNGFITLLSILPINNGDIMFSGVNKLISGSNDDEVFIVRTDSTLYSKPLYINLISFIIPQTIFLYQNYPNPFNPITKIKFDLTNSGFVTINIYNVTGRIIKTLINENLAAGVYEASFNSTDVQQSLSSGIYFYELLFEREIIATKKMILIK